MFVGMSFAEPPKSSTDKNGHYWCHFDSVHGPDCNTCSDGQMSQGPFSREPNCNKVCDAVAEGTNCSSASMTYRPGKVKGKTAKSVRTKAGTPGSSGSGKSGKTKPKGKSKKKPRGKKAGNKKGK